MYIVRRETPRGSGLMMDSNGKVAVFDSQDAAWAAIMKEARVSGMYTMAKVYELAGDRPRSTADYQV